MPKVSSVTYLHTRSIFVRMVLLTILRCLSLSETYRLHVLQSVHLVDKLCCFFSEEASPVRSCRSSGRDSGVPCISFSSQVTRKLKWVVGDLNSQPPSAWGDVNAHVQPVTPVYQPPGLDVLENRELLQHPLVKLSYLMQNNEERGRESNIPSIK